jgi:hypothetical protein
MPHDSFLSLPVAAETLAELGLPLTLERIRALIDTGELACAVYWLTQYRWLYVDPRGAARHEVKGWPEWAAARPEYLYPDEENPNPPLIYFTDERDHPNLNDRVGRPRLGGGGGLNLASFRPGLFIPSGALHELVTRETESVAQTVEMARQAVIDEAEARRAAPRTAQPASDGTSLPDWQLEKPEVFRGYTRPLYELLAKALAGRQVLPKVAQVMKAWRDEPPPGYGIRVSDDLRELTYCAGGDMPEKTVPSKAVQQAIDRMTGQRSRTK